MINENARERARVKERRNLVLQLLGDKCIRCGFTDKRALQIDHINGGGGAEFKNASSNNKRFYYKKVIESITKQEGKYQLLCANCNWIKRSENKNESNYVKKSLRKENDV